MAHFLEESLAKYVDLNELGSNKELIQKCLENQYNAIQKHCTGGDCDLCKKCKYNDDCCNHCSTTCVTNLSREILMRNLPSTKKCLEASMEE